MKPFYLWTRDLHLYCGLFLSPFVLVFAVSTMLLNHKWQSAQNATSDRRPPKQSVPLEVPGEMGTLEQARRILRQLGVTGEIDYVRHFIKEERLLIPVSKPGETTKIEVDLRARTASVERQELGLGAALIYLHKMPGPHNVKFRGNWIYMAWWRVLADTVVCGVLFLTVSGLYLWQILKAERKIGWALLAAGMFSAGALVTAICAA